MTARADLPFHQFLPSANMADVLGRMPSVIFAEALVSAR